MDERSGRARPPAEPQGPQTGGARPPAEPLDSLAARCAAHGPVESAGRFPPGAIFGDWRVTAFIGRGGNGEVSCAEHVTLGTPAAVKVLMREDDRAKARFAREAKLLANLKSDAFPRFFAYGEANGHPYLAMELLEPGDLPTGERAIARFLLKVCDAVAELHAQGFVHRDIKPSNILWRTGGSRSRAAAIPVLADFGLVKEISASNHQTTQPPNSPPTLGGVGTPGYGAPEQMERGEATVASDIHALGVLADRCFDGKPPRAWARIIQRATSSIPARRYPSVAAFARAVRCRHWLRNLLVVGFCVGVLTVSVAILRATSKSPSSGISSAETPSAETSTAIPQVEKALVATPQRGEVSEAASLHAAPRPAPTEAVISASAMVGGATARDARWFIDGQPIDMPHCVTQKDSQGSPGGTFHLYAVVKRGDKTYSAKRRISPGWQGTRTIAMQLKEDPEAGTPIRIWAGSGTSFDFVWCPPGEDEVSCVAEKGTSCTERVSVGCGYWIARQALTGRQFSAIREEKGVRQCLMVAHSPIVLDQDADLPVLLHFLEPNAVPSVYLRESGIRMEPPGLLQWEHAAQLGGGQKRPQALGMYDVHGNVPEWAWVSSGLTKRGGLNKDGWVQVGGACEDGHAALRDCAGKAARLLHGMAVPVYNGTSAGGGGAAGIRFVGISECEHETNTVLYCAAKGLLRSESPKDKAHGAAMMKDFLKSDDSGLVLLAREWGVARGRLSLEECGGTNAPPLLRRAAIRHGDAQTLECLAADDPDGKIREEAFARIAHPPPMVAARHIARVDRAYSDDMRLWMIMRTMTDREALEFISRHSPILRYRSSAKMQLELLDNPRR